jgi:hypothetical protein
VNQLAFHVFISWVKVSSAQEVILRDKSALGQSVYIYQLSCWKAKINLTKSPLLHYTQSRADKYTSRSNRRGSIRESVAARLLLQLNKLIFRILEQATGMLTLS